MKLDTKRRYRKAIALLRESKRLLQKAYNDHLSAVQKKAA